MKGWSLSRGLPLPEPFANGFKVEVGWPEQKARYVFPQLNDGFPRLLDTISEPWVFGKVCAAPEEVQKLLRGRWEIQDPGYLMTCSGRMTGPVMKLPAGYTLRTATEGMVTLVEILAEDASQAATGRIITVGDLAVYDRISTAAPHQRKGLATIVLQKLEQKAIENNITASALVASEQGRALYATLGWELLSPYTSVMIPGR